MTVVPSTLLLLEKDLTHICSVDPPYSLFSFKALSNNSCGYILGSNIVDSAVAVVLTTGVFFLVCFGLFFLIMFVAIFSILIWILIVFISPRQIRLIDPYRILAGKTPFGIGGGDGVILFQPILRNLFFSYSLILGVKSSQADPECSSPISLGITPYRCAMHDSPQQWTGGREMYFDQNLVSFFSRRHSYNYYLVG